MHGRSANTEIISELFYKQVNAQNKKNSLGSHKLLQAQCAMKVKETNKKKTMYQ